MSARFQSLVEQAKAYYRKSDIQAHPEDEGFKRGVAYDLDSYSNGCYYYDQGSDSTFIADKDAYEKCLKLRTKAHDIFSDEHTQKQMENTQYFEKKEWNSGTLRA